MTTMTPGRRSPVRGGHALLAFLIAASLALAGCDSGPPAGEFAAEVASRCRELVTTFVERAPESDPLSKDSTEADMDAGAVFYTEYSSALRDFASDVEALGRPRGQSQETFDQFIGAIVVAADYLGETAAQLRAHDARAASTAAANAVEFITTAEARAEEMQITGLAHCEDETEATASTETSRQAP